MLEFDVDLPLGHTRLEAAASLPMPGVTVLFGPSGAGKTSLLRCLAGFDGARGTIRFRDQCWLDTSNGICRRPHLRPVGFAFQDARLFTHLTVLGNLQFASRRAPEDAPGFDAVVDELDLHPLLDRQPAALSGGEQQRISLARAVLAGPQLLLLDEPLSALDSSRRQHIGNYIRSLPEQFDMRLIVVTHSVEEVARLATDMVVLNAGRVVDQGEPATLLERLLAGSVAEGFDAGVLLTARVEQVLPEDRTTMVSVSDQVLTLPEVLDEGLGGHVRLHIRSRDVAIATRDPSHISIRNHVRCRVIDIQPLPDGPFVDVVMGVGGQHLRARITVMAARELDIAAGQEVYALIKSVTLAS